MIFGKKKKSVEPLFEFGGQHTIWRLLLSPGSTIAVEERDTEARRVFFSAISLDTGQTLLNRFTPEEQYWTGMEALDDDVLLLHGFGRPDMPVHLGITAVEAASGRLLWHKPSYVFAALAADAVYALDKESRTPLYHKLDKLSGGILTADVDRAEVEETRTRSEENLFAGCRYPEPAAAASPGGLPPEEQKVLDALAGRESVEIVRHNGYLFMGSYSSGEPPRRHYFDMFKQGSTTPLFSKQLLRDAGETGNDSWFIKDDILFLLIDNRALSAYTLLP